MQEIQAFKSLNGTIYAQKEEAQAADQKWITQKIEDDLTNFLREKIAIHEKIQMIAERRSDIRTLFDKYDNPPVDAGRQMMGSGE